MAVFYKYQYTNKRKNIHPWKYHWGLEPNRDYFFEYIEEVSKTSWVRCHMNGSLVWEKELLKSSFSSIVNIKAEDLAPVNFPSEAQALVNFKS